MNLPRRQQVSSDVKQNADTASEITVNATLPADSENPILRKNPSIAEANTIEGVPGFSPVATLVTPLAGFKVGNSFLFPTLFITVACGAVSGFHSLISSGTTAKQLDNEKSAKMVGYGAMLIECLLAVISLICVASSYPFSGTV